MEPSNLNLKMTILTESRETAEFTYRSKLPPDILGTIFSMVKEYLPSFALVCRRWRTIIDDDICRNMCYPPEAFGAKKWREYIGEPGVETLLPRRVHNDLAKGNFLLTLIPEVVQITTREGTTESVKINERTIADLVKNPEKGHKTVYKIRRESDVTGQRSSCNDLWNISLDDAHKSHWILINKDVLYTQNNHYAQKKIAQAQSQLNPVELHELDFVRYFYRYRSPQSQCLGIRGADMSGCLDTIASIFLHFVESGNCWLKNAPVNNTWIYCDKMKTSTDRLGINFDAAGFFYLCNLGWRDYVDGTYGTLVAWKSNR
jgi:hypothetical protein